jgi:hypothetical protein
LLLAFAVGTDLAGALANRIVHAGETFLMYRVTLVAVVVASTVVLLAPLLQLTRTLVRARLDALDEYGAMGFELARTLRRESLAAARSGIAEPMKALISAHCDSGTGEELIETTRVVPITRDYVMSFVLAVVIPIALASLAHVPLPLVAEQLRRLLV